MSQKTTIVNVKHSGAPVYLGIVSGEHSFSCNPYNIARWMCDGYRARFNQHRSNRCKYDANKELIPIGDRVINITDKQARERYSYLSALPAMVIQAAEKKESKEWFAAAKRKRAIGGKMPRFKSRKRDDLHFVCWERGTELRLSGRKTAVLVIRGKNPPGKRKHPDSGARWQLKVRIRVNQPIRHYTSVIINITKGTVVFVNPPEPTKVNPISRGNSIVGCDRDGVIPMATSDGVCYRPDAHKISHWEKRKKFHQKKMGKARCRAKNTGGKSAMYAVMRGNNYQHHKLQAAKYSGKVSAYKYGWLQEATTELIRQYGTIVIENLNVKSMTKNGGKRKKGMNRSFLSASPATIEKMLTYKALLNGNRLACIPPQYTSQRCHQCGHTHKDNRESQAVFLCTRCGYTGNADDNAAINIKQFYEFLLQGTDLPAHDSVTDGGEVVKPTIPQGMIDQFYQGSFGDAADLQLFPRG